MIKEATGCRSTFEDLKEKFQTTFKKKLLMTTILEWIQNIFWAPFGRSSEVVLVWMQGR